MLPTLDFVSPVHFVMVITNLGSGGGGRPYGCRRRRGSRATYMAATIASTGARAAIRVSVSSAITVIFPSGSDAEQPQRDGDGKHRADGLSEHSDLQPVENPAEWSHAGRSGEEVRPAAPRQAPASCVLERLELVARTDGLTAGYGASLFKRRRPLPKTDLTDCRPKKVGPFLGRSHAGDFRENSCAAHSAPRFRQCLIIAPRSSTCRVQLHWYNLERVRLQRLRLACRSVARLIPILATRHGRACPGHACLWTDILNPL